MKRLLILLLLLKIAKLEAQSFNTAFQNYNEKGFFACEINGKTFISSEMYSPGLQDLTIVRGIDGTGQTTFSTQIQKHEFTSITRMKKTSDKALVMVGFGRGCDYLDGTQKTFVLKLDTTGNTIFDNTFFNIYPTFQNDYLKDITEAADSSYYCISDSVLFHFSKTGNLIKRINTNLNSLKTLFWYSDNKLLLSGKSGNIDNHFLIDTNGVILLSKPSAGYATKYEKLSSGNIICNPSNGVLTKLDQQLNIINSGTSGATDFVVINDTIFTVGQSSPSYIYHKLDSSFNINHQFATTAKRLIPSAITANNSEVTLFTSSTNTVNNSTSFCALTRFPKSSTFTYDNDIGVINVVTDSSGLNLVPSFTMSVAYSVYKLKIVVKNFGNAPVQDYFLNHYMYQNICGPQHYVKFVQNTLAPGATDTIITQILYGDVLGTIPSNSTVSVNFQKNMCVFTSVPNGKNDKDSDNDSYCSTVNFLYTDIAEKSLENNNADIYPNPFTGKFIIETDDFPGFIEVTNTAGNKLKSVSYYGKETEIDLNEFPAGIYLIKIASANSTVIKKAVKIN